MIEPVNNQNYYGYNKTIKGTASSDTGDSFSLAYREQKQKRDGEKDLLEENGVRVDLSGAGAQYRREGAQSQSAAMPGSWEEPVDLSESMKQAQNFLTKVRDTLLTFFANVKAFAVRFWNSEEVQEQSSEAVSGETADTAPDAPLEREPGWEVMQMQMLPTDEKEKQAIAARNTDLLTQYDRNGRIVQVSGSDRTRILKGNVGDLSG